ncbi:hypothetical protein ACFQX6_53685 [Streptosporangium lutulentum]
MNPDDLIGKLSGPLSLRSRIGNVVALLGGLGERCSSACCGPPNPRCRAVRTWPSACSSRSAWPGRVTASGR